MEAAETKAGQIASLPDFLKRPNRAESRIKIITALAVKSSMGRGSLAETMKRTACLGEEEARAGNSVWPTVQ